MNSTPALDNPELESKIPGLHPGWNVVHKYCHHPMSVLSRHEDPEWARLINEMSLRSREEFFQAIDTIRDHLGSGDTDKAAFMMRILLDYEVQIRKILLQSSLEDRDASSTWYQLKDCLDAYRNELGMAAHGGHLPWTLGRLNLVRQSWINSLERWVDQHYQY